MNLIEYLELLESDVSRSPWFVSPIYKSEDYAELYGPKVSGAKCVVLGSFIEAQFIAEFRNHARALLNVARAAVIAQRISSTSNMIALGEALAALENL